MNYVLKIREFVKKNKSTITFDEYCNNFMIKFKNRYIMPEEQEPEYTRFLSDLYNLDQEDYELWYKELNKVDFALIKDNLEFVNECIEKNNRVMFINAIEMIKKSNALVYRAMPPLYFSEDNFKQQELLKEYNKHVLSIKLKAENNVAQKIEKEFIKECGYFAEDENLKDFYLKTINNIEKLALEALKNNLRKVKEMEEKRELSKEARYIRDQQIALAKKKNNITKKFIKSL